MNNEQQHPAEPSPAALPSRRSRRRIIALSLAGVVAAVTVTAVSVVVFTLFVFSALFSDVVDLLADALSS